MSVNLNKQGGKVSLKKEELKRETEVNQRTETGSAGGERKKGLLPWIGILAVAVVIVAAVIMVSRPVSSGRTETDDEVSALTMHEEAETEQSIETAQSEEGNDLQSLTEDFQSEEAAETDNETDNEEVPMPAAASSQRTDDVAIHNYEVIVADITWNEAFAECIARGGYLCRINSEEENEKIKELLDSQNIRGVVYLGGMRDEDSDEYHWVDDNMEPFDEVLNDGEYIRFWYNGEPSYTDYVDGKEITEKYMAIIYPGSTKEWSWNDINDDVFSLAPDFYAGKLSYICEYE